MSSSDSEDDCYGNVAKKLENMKNKYLEDKMDCTTLLNDSRELDELVENAKLTAVKLKKTRKRKKDAQQPTEVPFSSTIIVSDDIPSGDASTNNGRRVTRSSAKRKAPEPVVIENSPTTSNLCVSAFDNEGTAATRGRRRGSAVSRSRGRQSRRGRGGRGRQSVNNSINSMMPIYSVGNTEDYPDQSDSQQLFSSHTKNDDVILVQDVETPDENEELSVKVYWQNLEIFKFTIRKYQKLSQIFDFFSKKENVSIEKLLFTYKDRILKPTDTPDSIDYNIAKFIDGGVVNHSISKLIMDNTDECVKDGVKIKFQCQDLKKPLEIVTGLDDRFSVAMTKCAELLELPIEKLKFEFDGDSISGKKTTRELELEGGECIDVKVLR